MKFLYRLVLFVLIGFQPAQGWSAISPQMTGYLVKTNPSLYGAEFQFSVLAEPFQKKSFLLGPRLGLIWAQGSDQSRIDFQIGAEGTLWFVNAIGAGMGIDLIPVSVTDDSSSGSVTQPVHLQLNPYLSARIFRYRCSGAWAIRAGVIYDTLYQWGANLGVSLQLSGVSNVADLSCSAD
jgi:hypothetical protein